MGQETRQLIQVDLSGRSAAGFAREKYKAILTQLQSDLD
jgi:hypothetical protein